jgi:hypothetical protein
MFDPVIHGAHTAHRGTVMMVTAVCLVAPDRLEGVHEDVGEVGMVDYLDGWEMVVGRGGQVCPYLYLVHSLGSV